MIDLKRNSKKEPIEATGLRSRKSSLYKPNQQEDFKISRGRFSNFLTCQRCFYLDRVRGFDPPSTPVGLSTKRLTYYSKKNLTIADIRRSHTEYFHKWTNSCCSI